MNPYLQDLTIRLAIGIAALDEPTRKRHADFLLNKQREDGGFAGREGESDLYYTGFALRSLGILGELYGEPAERSADFLRNRGKCARMGSHGDLQYPGSGRAGSELYLSRSSH